jgi:hypothetical protein
MEAESPPLNLPTIAKESQELALLLSSLGWKNHVLPVIGEDALKTRSLTAMESHSIPGVLHDAAVKITALQTFRKDLERKLTQHLAVLKKWDPPTYQDITALQIPTQPAAPKDEPLPQDPELSFDPFSDHPPVKS